MTDNLVHIVGVSGGRECIPPATSEIIDRAELLIGGARLLKMFPEINAEKLAIGNNLSEVITTIKHALTHRRVVVLASGDPNCYGIARNLTEALGTEQVKIIPGVSSFQQAFAAVKLPWDDAVLSSVHARPIEDIIGLVRRASKVALLTDKDHTPSNVARALIEAGIERQVYICQDLGTSDQRVYSGSLEETAKTEFSPLNVMILVSGPLPEKSSMPLIGQVDESFSQRTPDKGLITKMEVRAVSLAKLALREDSVVWDIGAGSGSVSIEAARLARRGHIFAVERSPESLEGLKANVEKFGLGNVSVIAGSAPGALAGLPDPDAVFIGGSGGSMADVLAMVAGKLRRGGRIVINLATLENLAEASRSLQTLGFDTDTLLVNIARSRAIGNLTRLEPLNPVFIVTATRQGEDK
ncbi:precorrin-6B C(5,15)-methyltransferase (decarboxylating) [Dehalogenimonas formicexedens]|uniref:Precorrin-6B C(5,15)-methyltransferase (Decarboxylating) n=1 Tax=Dehalogenimonas formicexedens TaxID=1839801 RepID=A0A1P8F9I9_9CHLR|nr:bifunctional cobalt-precorrin-7 (C(5))-methyltransferase/cobalt-precorrin-6B (C(15))-methyltransferase [Dehalogenimonas formicexedens]APV45100.1 precorrin-6B C(5,15)-methyltransferase (decarboxylating) [Dehalogenimonas formicexedens]